MLDATDCDSLQQLTPKQQAAIDLLLSGRNDRETAEVVGAHRTTISRWRLHDLAFVDELNRRRREVYGAAGERLRALLPKALDVLERQLDEGDGGLPAALAVCKLAGLDKVTPEQPPQQDKTDSDGYFRFDPDIAERMTREEMKTVSDALLLIEVSARRDRGTGGNGRLKQQWQDLTAADGVT